MPRKKIALVGAGQIGGTIALLATQKELGDIALIDVSEGVPMGKALDITQASVLQNVTTSCSGGCDYALMKDADVVIVTAGQASKPTMGRDELIGINTQIIKQVGSQIRELAPNAFVVVITNPLDVMVWVMQQVTGFPPNRIVGMANSLDAARFRAFIATELGISAENVTALLLGGHGERMVPLTRYCTVAGIPLLDLVTTGWLSHKRLDEIVERTRDGGTEIIKLLQTGSAFYAPACAAVEIAESYLKDQKRVLTCTAHLQGEYGQKDMFTGVPVVIGAEGVEKIIQLNLNEEEQVMFDLAAKNVQNLIDTARQILRPN